MAMSLNRVGAPARRRRSASTPNRVAAQSGLMQPEIGSKRSHLQCQMSMATENCTFVSTPRCLAEPHPDLGDEGRSGCLRGRVPSRRPSAAVRGEDCGAGTPSRTPGVGDRVSKGSAEERTVGQKRTYVRRCRPRGMSVTRGCVLMGLPRSTCYDAPSVAVDDTEIVSRLQAICDEFETYGYRRVGAVLRQHGVVVNSKRVRRLMREHDLQPGRRRRFIATTDSAHDLPVFRIPPGRSCPTAPTRSRNGDITYVAVAVRIRPCRADPRRVVAPRGRLCDRSVHRRAPRRDRAQGPPVGTPAF